MKARGSAGTRPQAKRATPSRERRSRAPQPRRAQRETGRGHRSSVSLTARTAVLAVALASVALTVALPFKIWLGQRGDIASLAAQTKAAQAQVDRLTAANRRWKDPAYVEQQAQQRLHYVIPGKKSYVVLGAPQAPHPHPQRSASTSDAPWYSQLWQSVTAAGTGAASGK